MDNALILLVQVVMMFLLAVMGYLMFRFKKITLEGSKSLGNILLIFTYIRAHNITHPFKTDFLI